jgi:hypothetical protein
MGAHDELVERLRAGADDARCTTEQGELPDYREVLRYADAMEEAADALAGAPTPAETVAVPKAEWDDLVRYVGRLKASMLTVDALDVAAAAGALVGAVRTEAQP